ncbi:MAG TPA: TIM-barrel domain-containing protein, partial [Verrucomicrobiae bacterium]
MVRIDFHGGHDDVRVYRNPVSAVEPVTPTITLSNVGDVSFDRFCAGAFGNYVALDEVRVATSWDQAVGGNQLGNGGVQAVSLSRTNMIGTGIAQFFPVGYDTNLVPSLALVSEPVVTGALTSSWSLFPQFTLVNSNAAVTLAVPPGASLYGGGEVNGPLLRNGQGVEIWATDTAGWSTDNLHRMYQAHPWVLGVRTNGTAFGVLFDSSYRASLGTGSNLITFASQGPLFRVIIIDRATPQAVLQGLGDLTGKMPLPPEWALGYHQSRFSYSPASQLQGIANGFLTNRIPCDSIWMDIGYMNNNRDFTVDPVNFANLPALTSWLRSRGFHAVNILDPAIAVDNTYPVYQSGTAGNYWVQTSAGTVFQGSSTPGTSVWPDFTMPGARSWWAGLCANFMTNGMDGLWIDMDEPSVNNAVTALNFMPGDNWHRGGGGLPAAAHRLYHNAYGMLEAQATYQGELTNNPNRRPFILSRANYLGGQRYAAVWTGDNGSTSNCMTVAIPMTLTLGLSGQPFSGPDLGGFFQTSTADLWGQWVGFGAFFPFCRAHATGSQQKEPWAFGVAVKTAAQTALNRRYRLMPYLYTQFYNSSQTGLPVMQPVFFADPADLSLRAEQQAFLLGGDLLVVPSFAQNPALPKGIWRSLALVPGDSGPYQAQLKVRGGAIIPAGAIVQNTAQNLFNPLTLIVCLDANGQASGTLYRDAGDGFTYQTGNYSLQSFSAQQTGSSVLVQVTGQQGSYNVSNTPVNIQVLTSNGVFFASGSLAAGISVAVDDRSAQTRKAFEGYNGAFLQQTNGQTFYQRSVTNNSYAGTWVQGLEIQVAEDAYDRSHSTFDQQLVYNLTTTFLAQENYPWSNDTWNDDIAWMTLACIRGYQITGNTNLLNQATNAWNMAYNRGWDAALGGGIWEDMNQKDAKCALSNDPMIVAGVALYQLTGQSAYLTKSQGIYAWVRSYLFNLTNGLVCECMMSNNTVKVTDNVYNSGAFINAANSLYQVTGNGGYYQDALLAAKHVLNNNVTLTAVGRGDSTWSDQFSRGLANFSRDNQVWGLFDAWFRNNANAAWNVRRPDLNITWDAWATPMVFDDSYSLECLSAAVIQQVLPALPANAPVFLAQPAHRFATQGGSVVLSALAAGAGTIAYQWYHEDKPIPGANATNLVLAPVLAADTGNYWVQASNSAAVAYSQIAKVYLVGAPVQDAAINYAASGWSGNQGSGFAGWRLSTTGGGAYISGDYPPRFGLWNSTSAARSTATRSFLQPFPSGG